MLPTPLTSLYRRYKKDTDAVAGWLASTATNLDFSPPSTVEADEHATQQMVPEGTNNPKNPGPKDKRQAYIIPISDFIPMASHIAMCIEKGAAISIPDALLSTLDRVISLRTRFGAGIPDYGAAGDETSGRRHSHFVNILKGVHRVLGSVVRSRRHANAGEVEKEFATLHLYEPSEVFLALTGLDHVDESKDDDQGATYEAENPATEGLFAFTVMMHDVYRLRSTIKWIWGNYRDGYFELASASLATNTAMEIARDIIAEVLPLVKHHDAKSLAKIHYLYFCNAREVSQADLFANDPEDNFNYDTYDIADEAMFNAYCLLESFAAVLRPNTLPICKDGIFGTYDPASDRSAKRGSQKFAEDRVLLMEFFTELATIDIMIDYPVEDEFLRGMHELVRTKTIHWFLVLAAQVFLDIHHEVRAKAENGFKDLFREVISARVDLAKHFAFHEKLGIKNWTKTHDDALRKLQEHLETIAKDPVYEAKAGHFRRMEMPVPKSMDRHRIYKRSPVLSGLILYQVRMEMHTIGVDAANAWGSIMFSGHLYDAIRSVGILEHRWPDMEIAKGFLGSSNFYVGEPPTSLKEFNKKFFLQMGGSVAAVSGTKASEGRKMPKIGDMMSKSGPRSFKGTVPVSRMFMGRYVDRIGRANWTLENIARAISRSNYMAEGTLQEGTLMMAKMNEAEMVSGMRFEGPNGPMPPGKQRPEELMKALVFALQSEAVELAFPYLHFHRVCWEMLRKVHESCRLELLRSCGPGYIGSENQLAFVVGYIFMGATGAIGGISDPTLLVMAAKAMGQVLSEGTGDVMLGVLMKGKGFRIKIEDSGSGGYGQITIGG